MPILNLTQHPATPDQVAAGVVDLDGAELAALRELLTFEQPPEADLIRDRAKAIATLAAQEAETGHGIALEAMIGGAPYLMGTLERALQDQGIAPVYAFTRREVEEVPQADGTVSKRAIFRHQGWVRPVGE